VLAHHVGVDVGGVDAEPAAEEGAEARGVERRARAEDAGRSHAPLGGEARGEVGHHVDRVRGHDEDGLRGLIEDGGNDLAEDGGVPGQQLEARLAGPLADARGQDDHARAGQVRVPAGHDVDGWAKGTACRMSSASARARASLRSTRTI